MGLSAISDLDTAEVKAKEPEKWNWLELVAEPGKEGQEILLGVFVPPKCRAPYSLFVSPGLE